MPQSRLAPWFGTKYPSLGDLETLGRVLGAPVVYGRCPGPPGLQWFEGEPLAIVIPSYNGALARAWGIAHEIAHLYLDHGLRHDPEQEAEADHWAAEALIPQRLVLAWGNASVDSFIAALSRNYQQVPAGRNAVRGLAAFIAYRRLEALNRWAVENDTERLA